MSGIIAAATALRDARGPAADCCVWARDVLSVAYGLEHLEHPELDALWCIWRAADGTVPLSRTWGPVRAAAEVGISEATVTLPRRGRWHLCQGWSGLDQGRVVEGSAGHTWLWFAVDREVGVAADSTRETGPRLGWCGWGRYPAIRAAVLRRPGQAT